MRLGLSHSAEALKRTSILCLFVAVCLFVFFVTVARLKPAFISYADAYANNMVNRVINEAVEQAFSENDYQNVSEFREVSGNSIKAVETNAAKINKLKTAINASIHDCISSYTPETVYVPLGSAANNYFFAGLGPKIPVRICPVGIVNTDIKEDFDDAGINQVHHKLYLDVSVNVAFAGIAFEDTKTVDTEVLLTETIIVGETPKYYGSGNISTAVE